LIKILSIHQIREADQYTIDHEPISSEALMERAAGLCFEWIKEQLPDTKQSFTVFAGSGNNGGDGLVIARMLHDSGYQVNVYLVCPNDTLSTDCRTNLERLEKILSVHFIKKQEDFFQIPANDIIIDALLGSGISRTPEGLVKQLIQEINTLGHQIISIDLPSGLLADSSSVQHKNQIVRADITLTIGAPKLALFMPENEDYCGKWVLILIGLDAHFLHHVSPKYFQLEQNDIASTFHPRKTFSHKGTYGHALIMAGSKGKTGAAVLAARSCLRSGCGLTTVHGPAGSLNILQTAAPEAMCTIDKEPDCISEIPDLTPYSAIAFGPGCGLHKTTATTLKRLIQETKVPLVIDADGLNMLADNKTWLAFLPANTVLTPHPGEFKRLFGTSENDFDRLQKGIDAAIKFRCIIILKGAYTAIISPNGPVYFNSTGNPGMAKGGSGDVLTGFIVGLLARGIPALEAAKAGVYLHGLAGDFAAKKKTEEAMHAGDIVEYLPPAWASMLHQG